MKSNLKSPSSSKPTKSFAFDRSGRSSRSGIFRVIEKDDPLFRLKMGRCSGQSEAEMEALVRDGWYPPLVRRIFESHPTNFMMMSSRPDMGGGTRSFHFSHRVVTKRYVRPVPADRVYYAGKPDSKDNFKYDRHVMIDGRRGCYYSFASSTGSPSTGGDVITPVACSTGLSASVAAGYVDYIGRDEARAYSCGSGLGDDVELRAKYFEDVAEIERSGGRIQSRIIAELPYYLPLEWMKVAVHDFTDFLGEHGLPCWAVIHRPESQSDKRNWHCHIVYHDRKVEGYFNGVPIFSDKNPVVRSRDWIVRLREKWAEVVNVQLDAHNDRRVASAKILRFHPGSYESVGLRKIPARHLGMAAMSLERSGILTGVGREAVASELLWRREVRGDLDRRWGEALERFVLGSINRVSVNSMSEVLDEHTQYLLMEARERGQLFLQTFARLRERLWRLREARMEVRHAPRRLMTVGENETSSGTLSPVFANGVQVMGNVDSTGGVERASIMDFAGKWRQRLVGVASLLRDNLRDDIGDCRRERGEFLLACENIAGWSLVLEYRAACGRLEKLKQGKVSEAELCNLRLRRSGGEQGLDKQIAIHEGLIFRLRGRRVRTPDEEREVVGQERLCAEILTSLLANPCAYAQAVEHKVIAGLKERVGVGVKGMRRQTTF